MIFQIITKKDTPKLSDDIFIHLDYIINKIYKIPFKNLVNYNLGNPDEFEKEHNKISRGLHGILHITRTTFLIETFAKLYKEFADPSKFPIDELTERNIKLIQIAALFHDSGRKDSGIDYWGGDSGINCFYYLYNNLGIEENEAKMIAEAIINKDTILQTNSVKSDYYYHKSIIKINNQFYIDNGIKRSHRERSIVQILLHDADCLELIRTVSTRSFNHYKLYIYNYVKSNTLLRLINTILDIVKTYRIFIKGVFFDYFKRYDVDKIECFEIPSDKVLKIHNSFKDFNNNIFDLQNSITIKDIKHQVRCYYGAYKKCRIKGDESKYIQSDEIIYRSIRHDEDLTLEIKPKNPNNKVSPAGHLSAWVKGTQYISFTRSLNVAHIWSTLFDSSVVSINLDLLNNNIIDLYDKEIRDHYIKSATIRAMAKGASEVLIEGEISSKAIIKVLSEYRIESFISTFIKENTHRLRVRNINTNEVSVIEHRQYKPIKEGDRILI